MGKGKQLSVNLITQIVSFALNLSISFFLTPYIIQYIGKDVYGFVSLANNFTSYITVFTIALNGILNRYVTIAFSRKDYQQASKYFSSVIIANLIIMIILLPISIIFIANLGSFINLTSGFELDIKMLFLLVFLSFLINLPGGCFNSSTYATNRLDLSNICNMLGNIIKIAIILIMIFTMTPHVWYVGIGTLISTIFIIVMNMSYKKKLTPQIKISIKYFEWKSVKELLGVGIWNSVNQLTQLLMTGLDLIIANLFISVLSMNLLSYAKMIPTQLLSLISTVSGTFAPVMTTAYASNDTNKFVHETNNAIKLCGFMCSVPIIGLIVFGEDFFSLWLSVLSSEEVHTVEILSILTILPNVFSVYIYPLYTVNTVTAKLKVPVLVSAVLGVLNVVIVFILVQVTNWEIYAVAGVSSVLSVGRILIFVPMYAAHSINVPYITFYKPLFRGLSGSLVMLIIFTVIRSIVNINSWFSFILVCGFAGIVGYIISFIVVFNNSEKKQLFNMIMIRLRG